MMNMKACVLESPNRLVVSDVEVPKLQPDELLIKVMACGVCGSDIRYYKGDNPWALHTLGKNLPNPPNMILGHEFAGVVCDIGSKDLLSWKNRRVAIEPYYTCGTCALCRTGRHHLCKNTLHIGHGAGWSKRAYYPGGMAQYCACRVTHAYEIPEHISFDEAVLLDPLAVAVHAVKVSDIVPSDAVLIQGAGTVGLCLCSVLRAYGCHFIAVTDPISFRLDMAKTWGVDEAMHPTKLRERSDENSDMGFDVVFDTVGDQKTFDVGMPLLKPSGRYVSMVAEAEKIDFCWSMLSAERSMVVSANNQYGDFLEAIRLMEKAKGAYQTLITHRYAMEQVQNAIDAMMQNETSKVVKALIRPWETVWS